MYETVIRPLLFSLAPSSAHRVGMRALSLLEWLPLGGPPTDPSLRVEAMGLSFPGPVGLAGGFDKDGERARALSRLGFGFLELGTVTAIPQGEIPRPNLFRLPDDRALINRLGFPNRGAAELAERLGRLREKRSIPIAVSIGKSRVVSVDSLEDVTRDYLTSLRAVMGVSDFVVVNVSSPNTVGLRSLQASSNARALLSALREETDKPLLVKLSPDLTDEEADELLAVVREVSFSGVVATNTTVSRQDLKTRPEEIAAMGAGGLSGPPLRARALAMVTRARMALGPDATVIGVGGIENAEHVRAFRKAGANLVQVYTGFVYGGPSLIRRMHRALAMPLEGSSAPRVRP